MERGTRPIPNRLTLLRRLQGYKQKDAARLLGLYDAVALRQWEQGKSLPSSANLIRLCILYRTYANDLYPQYFKEAKEKMDRMELRFFETKNL